MCVIVGMKLPRDKSGKPTEDAKWRLAKIRDRTYVPELSVKRYSVLDDKSEQLFLVDQDTDWTEGCSVLSNGKYLGIVNAALNNSSDKKDDGSKGDKKNNKVSKNGKVLRRALKQTTIEKAVKVLVDESIDGNTIITDGDRVFVIECYIPESIKDKYKDLVVNGKTFEDLIKSDEYICHVEEIKEDDLVVRTNHGIFLPDAGYQPKDGDSYISSTRRRKYAIEALEARVFHPIDLIIQLSRLQKEEIDKNAFYRPIRLKDVAKSKDTDVEIFSTAVIYLDPSGTIFLRPIECKVTDISVSKLTDKNRQANLVILPAHIPLFEKSYNKYINNEDLIY